MVLSASVVAAAGWGPWLIDRQSSGPSGLAQVTQPSPNPSDNPKTERVCPPLRRTGPGGHEIVVLDETTTGGKFEVSVGSMVIVCLTARRGMHWGAVEGYEPTIVVANEPHVPPPPTDRDRAFLKAHPGFDQPIPRWAGHQVDVKDWRADFTAALPGTTRLIAEANVDCPQPPPSSHSVVMCDGVVDHFVVTLVVG